MSAPDYKPVKTSKVGTAYWFAFLFVLAPLVGWLETPKQLPQSIHETMKRN